MNAPCRRAESFRRISAAEGFHRPRRLVKNTFSPALLWSRVDGVARGVYFCHGTGGNEGCRKASPYSIWARAACIHGRLACATSRWRSIGPADTRSRLCLARKTPRPYSVSPSMPHDHAAGVVAPYALTRVPPAVQGYVQYYSATERFPLRGEVSNHKGIFDERTPAAVKRSRRVGCIRIRPARRPGGGEVAVRPGPGVKPASRCTGLAGRYFQT